MSSKLNIHAKARRDREPGYLVADVTDFPSASSGAAFISIGIDVHYPNVPGGADEVSIYVDRTPEAVLQASRAISALANALEDLAASVDQA